MKRILIIETDPILRGIYRRKFEMSGYQVETSDEGTKALARLPSFAPELILMDISLPGMDGSQVIRKIRAVPEFKTVPIIVLSSFYRPDLAKQAWQAGASKCISKLDCTPNLALELVEQVFSGEPSHPVPAPTKPLRSRITPEPPKESERLIPEATPTFSTSKTSAPSSRGTLPFAEPQSLVPSAHQPGGLTEFRREQTPVPETAPPFAPAPSPPTTPPFAPAPSPPTTPPFRRSPLESAPPEPVVDPQSNTSRWTASSGTAFHVEVRHEFFRRMPEMQATLRDRISALAKCKGPEEQLQLLEQLGVPLSSLTGLAGVTGYTRIAHLSGALEALIKDVQKKPKQLTSSVLRTFAHACDCLTSLIRDARQLPQSIPQSMLILAVDDEPISRRSITVALSKASLRCVCMEDSRMALKVLQDNSFDLIFLDAEMPGLNGFELCTELRKLPTNNATPVIFVTSLTHFEIRARSSLSGGNDLIAKPFLMMELAVKALTYLLKARPTGDTLIASAPPAA